MLKFDQNEINLLYYALEINISVLDFLLPFSVEAAFPRVYFWCQQVDKMAMVISKFSAALKSKA